VSFTLPRGGNAMPELCYEYFDCQDKDCINRKEKRVDCWNVASDTCIQNIANIGKIPFSSKDGCEKCIYRKYIKERKNI
jgi:hypothetical protein